MGCTAHARFIHYFHYRVHNHISWSLESTANDIGLPYGVDVYNADRVTLQEVDSWQKCPCWCQFSNDLSLVVLFKANRYENYTSFILLFFGLEPSLSSFVMIIPSLIQL